MKHLRLKRAVEKFADVVKDDRMGTIFYSSEVDGRVITWIVPSDSPEEAHCVNVRRENDKDDWVSDYHAGSYYHTIKSAIRALTYNLNKEKTT